MRFAFTLIILLHLPVIATAGGVCALDTLFQTLYFSDTPLLSSCPNQCKSSPTYYLKDPHHHKIAGLHIIPDKNERYIASWYAELGSDKFWNKPYYNYFIQILSQEGVTLSTPKMLSSHNPETLKLFEPKSPILIPTADNILALFQYPNQTGSGRSIYGRLFSHRLKALDREYAIDSLSDVDDFDPTAAILDTGNIVVAWTRNDWSSSQSIMLRLLNPEGNPIKKTLKAGHIKQAGHQYHPKVTALSEGSFLLTWHDKHRAVLGQLYNHHLEVTSPIFKINQQQAILPGFASSTQLSNGSFVVAWHNNVGEIFTRIFSEEGQAITNEFKVNTSPLIGQFLPSVTALQDNRFIISWYGNKIEEKGSTIYARIFDHMGREAVGNFTVSESSSFQTHPQAITLPGKYALLTWQEHPSETYSYFAFKTIDATDPFCLR